jgi:RNA polymerase sigma-70 factor (ECF subfamily)
MRHLTWIELIDLLTANPGDAVVIDAAWGEIHRRVSIFLTIIRRGSPAVSEEDAEDLVQQLVLRMHDLRVLNAIRSAQAPHAYVMRMARNSAIDHLRRRSQEVPLSLEPTAVASREAAADVAVLMRAISAEDQILLKMRFWDDMSIGEIAGALDLPYSTVAKRLFRAVEKLRKRTGESGSTN